jgi:serine protease Do
VTAEIADGLGLKTAEGALVAEPQKDGPAAKAGIESGDVITSVDDTPVRNARDLARKIGGLPPGTTVKLGLFRKGSDKTVSLTLGELPSMREARAERRDRDYDYRRGRDRDERSDRRRDRNDEQRSERDYDRSEGPRLGLSLAPAGNEPGVVVAEVDPSGPAADFGFKPGDVILDVAGKMVDTPADVRKALGEARAQGKRSVLLRIKTEQGTRFVAIPLERA